MRCRGGHTPFIARFVSPVLYAIAVAAAWPHGALGYKEAVPLLLRDLASFALVAGLLTIVPGLDTAMVLRSTTAHGRRHGLATALGVNSGALVWGAGAAVGISALTASVVAYTVMRIAGAMYMLWIGSRLVLHAVRGEHDSLDAGDESAGSRSRRESQRQAARQRRKRAQHRGRGSDLLGVFHTTPAADRMAARTHSAGGTPVVRPSTR